MISRRTIVWFVLLMAFTVALSYEQYLFDKSCWEWRAHHFFGQTRETISSPDGNQVAVIDLCGMWYALPWWIDGTASGWLISFAAFVFSLASDLLRWRRLRKTGKRT